MLILKWHNSFIKMRADTSLHRVELFVTFVDPGFDPVDSFVSFWPFKT